MFTGKLTRRSFLQLSGLSLSSLALRPMPPQDGPATLELGRVASSWVNLYPEPSLRAKPAGRFLRDEIVELLGRERSDEGPFHNPVWLRLPDGYLHSGNVQLVRWEPQIPRSYIPPEGALFEVSVPYSRTYDQPDPSSKPRYRLYYQSTHWVEDVVSGADGRQWYQILNDRLKVNYYIRAEHMRMIEAHELSPISAEIPAKAKWIEVNLEWQELRAYEHRRLVLRTSVSTGIPDPRPRENGIPTLTPSGRFSIGTKTTSRHMGDGRLTSDLEAYELPGVPWVMFFHHTGVALHGTYWHNDYGRPRSHGCVNLRCEDAKWLYRWTMPASPHYEKIMTGRGTIIHVS